MTYSRSRRSRIKTELVASRGGRCADCGYCRSAWALDFHHLNAADKLFALGGFLGSMERARIEAEKCVLVCANCHRRRHAATKSRGTDPTTRVRQDLKLRAVAAMSGLCIGCGLNEPVDALEFHHLDPATKEFGISTEGIPRRWDEIEAELTKCVLVCANCHREVHAGVRQVSEDEGPYATETDPLHKRCA